MKINEMSLGWPEKLGAMSGQPSPVLIQPSIMGVKGSFTGPRHSAGRLTALMGSTHLEYKPHCGAPSSATEATTSPHPGSF